MEGHTSKLLPWRSKHWGIYSLIMVLSSLAVLISRGVHWVVPTWGQAHFLVLDEVLGQRRKIQTLESFGDCLHNFLWTQMGQGCRVGPQQHWSFGLCQGTLGSSWMDPSPVKSFPVNSHHGWFSLNSYIQAIRNWFWLTRQKVIDGKMLTTQIVTGLRVLTRFGNGME